MSFNAPRLTNAGRNLQLKSLTGVPLNFTKIQMGDGNLTTQAPSNLTELINPLVNIDISNFNRGQDYVTIGGTFTNSSLQNGFYWREIGLFANDPDDGEILYCYQNAYDLAEYITAAGSEIIEKSINISVIANDTQNICATINESLIFATIENLENHTHKLADGQTPGFSQNNFSDADKEKIQNLAGNNLSEATGILLIKNGGTGATSTEQAKNNLGLGINSSVQFSNLTVSSLIVNNQTLNLVYTQETQPTNANNGSLWAW